MLNVIYEDKDKIIVNKPAGQLSQSARGFDMDLVSEVLTYRKNKGEEAYAAIINRLDRPVSGLVLIAKNKKEAARLSALMQRESLCKQYLVLVCGRPHSDTGTFTDYLLKNSKDNTSKVVSKEQAGAKKAVLEYSLIDYDDERNVSRLLINLITGRHHQIRVQLSSRNLPVVGDGKYGGGEAENQGDGWGAGIGGDLSRKRPGRNAIGACRIFQCFKGRHRTAHASHSPVHEHPRHA